MGDDNQHRSRAKVPNPQPYDESVKDLRYLKKWFNRLKNYTKLNDEYLRFFEGGEYSTWTCKRDDATFGVQVQPRAAAAGPRIVLEITAQDARLKTQSLIRDLESLLLTLADYVPLGYYDMLLEQATSNHSKQNVLVAVVDATGYVLTTFVKSEQAPDLAQGIAKLVLPFRLGPQAVIRVDQARGPVKAGTSPLLDKLGIKLDPGDSKNKNMCAIVDKAIQELEMELKRLNPEGSNLTDLTLLLGSHHLNSKVRPSKNNLRSKEVLLLRDQFTGDQLDLNDSEVISAQHERRLKSHPTSVKTVPRIPLQRNLQVI